MSEPEGKSITWVIVMTMLVVAWVGWSSLATAYVRSIEGPTTLAAEDLDDEIPRFSRRRATTRGLAAITAAFMEWVINGFTQIPNLVSVIRFGLTERMWLVGMFGGIEIAVLFLGLKMKALEASFADSPDYDGPPRRRRKKRRKK